ncbi:MAG: hypothetical protein M3O36_20070 [Myxococcota bacterium]|nr:hypothetical protein [Myxococcota bacterium]
MLVGAVLLAATHARDIDWNAPSAEAAMAKALTRRGLTCEAVDVAWVTTSSSFWGGLRRVLGRGAVARALVRARTPDSPSDLYLVEARLSPEGAVLEVGAAWNVTDTSGVDESRPAVRGALAVYSTTADGLCTGVHVLDLAGRSGASPGAYRDFTRLQRLQAALTNLQQTGQAAGIVHDTFALDPVAGRATVSWLDDERVEVHADEREIVIDARSSRVLSGEKYVRVVRDERARPGSLATWAVDRVRAMPWFGDERMQWVKAVAFTALDRYREHFSGATTSEEVQDELGLRRPAAGASPFSDPDVGWPPQPIKPLVAPPLAGEGRWITLDRDPFITPTPGGGDPAFVTSFLRPDPRRPDVRVYVTLWDPRQIALHMEAGTVEPISANGEHGPGLVPRTPAVLKRLVAAFNGGFQAQHGEYGMFAGGIEYLPPKPYAATVLELRDGSNAFGAWPGPQPDHPASANAPSDGASAVLDGVIGFRQNLTALVQDGRFNPWGRSWWGGTPPGWPDQIHSARSGICLTKEGFAGYFYSTSISAEDLAQGMIASRCSFGIHLDMNPGHAGFEFYDVVPEGQLAALGRPLQNDWEAEGKVPGLPGLVFRSRRMIRGMGHMLFPRYIQREARDFFYLTLRPALPGAPIDAGPAALPDEGIWHTRGLPQHGFPYALATTWIRARADADMVSALRLRVLRADPRTMQPAAVALEAKGDPAESATVLALSAATRGTLSLWWSHGVFAVGAAAPSEGATEIVLGVEPAAPAAAIARAVVGVQEDDGMLAWVELPPEAHADAESAAAMIRVLERLGCSARMAIPGQANAWLGGSSGLSGTPLPMAHVPFAARFVRARAPDAHLTFADTPIVTSQVWQPLQAKRVRYFYKPAPIAPASSLPPSSIATAPTSASARAAGR